MKQSKFHPYLTFFYALLSGVKINIVGQLGANEILSIFYSLSLKRLRLLWINIPDLRKVNSGYMLYLMSQVVSDILNSSTLTNSIRGWANIIVAILVTNFLAALLYTKISNLIYYLCGAIFTVLLFGDVQAEGISLQNMGFFKFRVVPALNAVVLMYLWYSIKFKRSQALKIVLLAVSYGIFNVAFDSRSNGLIFILLALIFAFKKSILKITFKRFIPALLLGFAFFQMLYSIYVYQVESGNLGGDHARAQLSRISNPYNPLTLLMTGRAETYAGLIAALDKPIIGHGSWAEDPTGKYRVIVYQLHQEEDQFDLKESGETKIIIPSHSVLIGAWMNAGIFGFLSIFYIVYLFYKNLIKIIKTKIFLNSPYYPIVIFYSIVFIWTLLFSPLSHIKQSVPIMIAVCLVIGRKLELYRKREPHNIYKILKNDS